MLQEPGAALRLVQLGFRPLGIVLPAEAFLKLCLGQRQPFARLQLGHINDLVGYVGRGHVVSDSTDQ